MTKQAPFTGEAVVKRGLAKIGKRHTPRMCQKEIRLLFGVPSIGDHDKDGDADAHDAWKSARAKGRVVVNRDAKKAPSGAYLYFSGGTNGHVALGLGGNDCVSTDAGGSGIWGRAKITDLERRWNRHYEGYIVITGNDYRVFDEPDKTVPTTKTRYEVTATRLNAHSGPGLGYSVKKTREKGFKFNSTVEQGDWVQSTSYWYHKDHVKVVSTAQPSSTRFRVTANRLNARSGPGLNYPVKAVRSKGFSFTSKKKSGPWRQATSHWYHEDYLAVVTEPAKNTSILVGTLNIPLDAAKIAGGNERAKEAAKQINAANLAVVAVQELDRGAQGTTHRYAEQLRHELGDGWAMFAPTTKWNENYTFVRTVVASGSGMADKILTSSARRSHATRVTLKKDGRSFTILNTHLVSGAKNGAAREAQGRQLATISDATTIILGDLNQQAVPKDLALTHKTARDHAKTATNNQYGTYAKWGNKKASKAVSSFLDHVLVPVNADVNGYTVIGIKQDGYLSVPRASDHLLVIASITI